MSEAIGSSAKVADRIGPLNTYLNCLATRAEQENSTDIEAVKRAIHGACPAEADALAKALAPDVDPEKFESGRASLESRGATMGIKHARVPTAEAVRSQINGIMALMKPLVDYSKCMARAAKSADDRKSASAIIAERIVDACPGEESAVRNTAKAASSTGTRPITPLGSSRADRVKFAQKTVEILREDPGYYDR
jgi:DNA-binding transcriptional regulator YdaS (Cro superfamily)